MIVINGRNVWYSILNNRINICDWQCYYIWITYITTGWTNQSWVRVYSMHLHFSGSLSLSYCYAAVFFSEIISWRIFCVYFSFPTPKFSAQLFIIYAKNSFITHCRLLLPSTFIGPHICFHLDCHIEINAPQDLPLTFMIYVPKRGKPQGTSREGNQMAFTAKMSFHSGSYELLERASRILLSMMCNQHLRIS